MSYISPIKLDQIPQMEEGWAEQIGKYIAGEVDNLVLESCVKVGCHVDKDELEKALRYDRDQYAKGYADGKRDAADAIEELQEQVRMLDKHDTDLHNEGYDVGYYAGRRDWEPKHGEWILCGAVGWPNWKCTVCHGEGRGDYLFCPWCGAKMGVQE